MRDDLTLLFFYWVCLFMPVLGVLSYYRVKSGKPLAPKRRRFLATMVIELWLLGLALGANRPHSLPLFPRTLPDATGLFYGAVVLGSLLLAAGKGLTRAPAERLQKLRQRLPENAQELGWWAVISLLAGFCEEIGYRGVLYGMLLDAWHSVPLAILVAVVVFAVAHAMQGPRGMLGVGVFGLLFHALVLVTGTLYVGMAVHATYDFALGFLAMRTFRGPAQPTPAET
ncbi:MAG TPA: CPBP family intramembrane glutamic endopeptidase [Terriglobales bacterium]|jgi:membrane protease YdiL (CAAX protease family)|nr:CPBP family intramembrane glutamic endopeptidase [Terriglobales bacterium]